MKGEIGKGKEGEKRTKENRKRKEEREGKQERGSHKWHNNNLLTALQRDHNN